MGQPKKKTAQVEIRYQTPSGEVLSTSTRERVLHWAGARKGWFLMDLRSNKEFLTEQEPPLVVRIVRPVETTQPL